MNFTFHNGQGREINIADFETFKTLLASGQIQSNTLLFDRETGLWKPASEHDAYHAAKQALQAPPNDYRPAADYGVVNAGAPFSSSPYDAYAPPSEKGWLIALSAVLLLAGAGLLVASTIAFTFTPFDAGYRIGQAMGGTLLVAVLAFFIWRLPKKKSKGAGLAIFAAGFLLVALGNSVSAWRSYDNQKRALRDMSSVVRDLGDGKELSLRDLDEKQYGEMAPMMKLATAYLQTVANDFQELNRRMQEERIDTLLTKETLQDAAHIDVGRQHLQTIMAALDRTEELQRQRADDMISRVNNSNLPESRKREFLKGFNSTKEQSLAQVSVYFRLERDILAKIDEVLNFVRGRKYSFSGEQIAFRSPADAADYNHLLDEIRLLANKEAEWERDSQQRRNEGLEKLQQDVFRK